MSVIFKILRYVIILLGINPFTLASAAESLQVNDVRHFLSRTTFGVMEADVARWQGRSRMVLVEHVLAQAKLAAGQVLASPRAEVLQRVPDYRRENSQQRRQRRGEGWQLKGWYIQQLLNSHSPFFEQMVLFWQGHFTTALRKVKYPRLIYQQHVLIRHYALLNYADMLREILRDPAMLIYLDGYRNQRGAPNENFAREILELFTLGAGAYSEQDVAAFAQLLTGFVVENGTVRIDPTRQDRRPVRFLGHDHVSSLDEAVEHVLSQPALSQAIVSKLWRHFISPTPNPEYIALWAQAFRESGYAIAPLMRTLLQSEPFWQESHRGVLIKSPLEMLLGTVKLLETPVKSPVSLARYSRQLGQDLFDPATVKGWPQYVDWITPTSLQARYSLLRSAGDDYRRRRQAHGMEETSIPRWVLFPSVSPVQKISTLALPEALLDIRYQLK